MTLSQEQVLRYYTRGKKKLDKVLRIQNWLTMVLDLDVYFKEMKQLHVSSMSRIKRHHNKVVGIDTESSNYDTDEEDAKNAEDDCEHTECHRVYCKLKNN